ncbi:hypothetical protein FRUB_06144 [Fimbriiglobus ruber]|uniref:Uncharacterized protein n=1 Tax=Fimbriiglobus ruber TaxID=1908690 RepID=A0A225DC51_9BACT|nr:hypothetical protein FRUB_06144 [Fimbriiglobus ruber]
MPGLVDQLAASEGQKSKRPLECGPRDEQRKEAYYLSPY